MIDFSEIFDITWNLFEKVFEKDLWIVKMNFKRNKNDFWKSLMIDQIFIMFA